MTVCSGLIMPKLSAFLSPNLFYQLYSQTQQRVNLPDTVVDVNLPLLGRDTTGLGVPNGVNTSGEVHLSSTLEVSGDTDNRALGSVFRDQSSGVSPKLSALLNETETKHTKWKERQ